MFRPTRAQSLIVTAVLVPLLAKLVWRYLNPEGELGWGYDEPRTVLALVLVNSLILPIPLALLTLGLLDAKPSGRAGHELRRMALSIVALLCLLGGIAVAVSKISEPGFRRTDVGLPLLLLGVFVIYRTYKENAPRFGRISIPHQLIALFVCLTMFIGAFGLSMLVALSGQIALAHATYYALFFGLLALWPLSMAVNAFLRWWAGKQGTGDVLFGFSPFMPLDWREMDLEEAQRCWESIYDAPPGATLLAGYSSKAGDLVRVKWQTSDGDRWQCVRNAPVVWPQWVAGLFLRSDREHGRVRPRFFDSLDCRWETSNGRALRPSVSTSARALRSSQRFSAWSCPDCGELRFDFIDQTGARCSAFTDAPRESEPKWFAGFIFMYARTSPRAAAATAAPAIAG